MLMLRTVGARFPGNSTVYTYFVPEGDNPEVGDLLVTSVHFAPELRTINPYQSRVGNNLIIDNEAMATTLGDAKMATVVEVPPLGTPAPKASKFYVALVKAAAVAERALRNAELFQRVQLDRAARKELDDMLRQEDTRLRYQRLAETNPRARELLVQLGELPPIERKPDVAAAEEAPRKARRSAYHGGSGVEPQNVNPTVSRGSAGKWDD